MADIRIKDLTTLESASLTGDVFVIDGTTGTRKLSAFSPSFGGNTTVAGTLGVGGATVASRLHVYESTSGTGDSNGITIEQASTADAALQFLLTGVQRWTVGIDNSDSDKFKIGTGAIGAADGLTIDTSGNLSIPATTASTSTSSGALVVSGGVGVAGSIWAGVRLNVEYPTAANGSEHNVIKGIMGTDATLGALELNMGVLPSATAGSRYGYIACQDSLANRGIYLGGRPGQGPGGATIYVPSTASSTSTSSGALVVDGGVGVAGAVNAGTFYGLVDGVTAPATESGYARIYVDSADGDLKVKFGDGTIKTIATDT